MPIPVVVSWSGGKDSALVLDRLRRDDRYQVQALLTTVTGSFDRVSMHGIRRSVLEAQVARIGVPLFDAEIPAEAPNGAYEAAFARALDRVHARYPRVRTVAFGDLFLQDVRAYREEMLAGLGWEPVFPLWGEDTRVLARRFVDDGFRAVLCCVDTEQLDADFSGRAYDGTLLAELPDEVDPCGERGEFHTCVWDGPIFTRPVELRRGERVLREARFEYCDLALVPPDSTGPRTPSRAPAGPAPPGT